MEAVEEQRRQTAEMEYQHEQAQQLASEENQEEDLAAHQPYTRDGSKIGRNDPCPCGSGKKFKQCHGAIR